MDSVWEFLVEVVFTAVQIFISWTGEVLLWFMTAGRHRPQFVVEENGPPVFNLSFALGAMFWVGAIGLVWKAL